MHYTKPSCKKIPGSNSPNPITFSVYNKLVASAKYFNQLQIRNVNLALFFFLAAFIAIGTTLNQMQGIPFNRFIVVLPIGIASIIVILFFFVMDAFFYNKYLETTVNELADLEKEHPWLPQVHTRMIFLVGRTSIVQKSATYLSFMLIISAFIILDLVIIKNAS